jgi:hypothetical protein
MESDACSRSAQRLFGHGLPLRFIAAVRSGGRRVDLVHNKGFPKNF